MINQHGKLNYVELPSTDLNATKTFFTTAFNWTFSDYGDEYTAFTDQGLNGGFYAAPHCASTDNGAALLVFYSEDLQQTLSQVRAAGGTIAKEIFSFPGGRRFHFCEPGGNELAVWSDK